MITKINPNKVSVSPITWQDMKADAERDIIRRNQAQLIKEGRPTPPANMGFWS